MQITKTTPTPTTVTLRLIARAEELEPIKQTVVQRLAANVKLQGFRSGKAPLNLVERNLDPNQLQQEFLEQAVNDLYVQAIDQEKVRPVAQPTISITKFVPFTDLEVTAEVEAVGAIKLADYKKISVKKQPVKVEAAQIDAVIDDLRQRFADKTDVDRAAKDGDEATINFAGTDPKTKQPLPNTDGQDFPLLLGSGNFIPGFEAEIIGMKTGDDKTFTITFPADYGVVDMQGKAVVFTVSVTKLQQITLPKLDAALAAKIGPFTSVKDLQQDVRRELEQQAAGDVERQYENQLLEAIAEKSVVEIPDRLIDEELERLEQQDRQNVMYRGQTWQEHLDNEGVSEEEHRAKNRPAAELRVKSGLLLGEIADKEQIRVTPEELEIRIQLLKGQYATDERMLAELEKPENRRDVMSRLMTEKTLDVIKAT